VIGEYLAEKFANGEDGDIKVLAQVQEVMVAGYEVVCPGDDGTTQENIIIRVVGHEGHPPP
jgi:hypothetical protein